MVYYPHARVQRVSCLQDPWAHHQPLWMWSRHVPQLSRPVAFSTGVVAVAGSAIIAPTILDNTTTTTPATPPYNILLHLHPGPAEQILHSQKSAPTTCCDARDTTTLRPPPHINTTPGSALTPTALPIVPESRLHATANDGSLDLIFDEPRFRAGKDDRKLTLDMLNGQ